VIEHVRYTREINRNEGDFTSIFSAKRARGFESLRARGSATTRRTARSGLCSRSAKRRNSHIDQGKCYVSSVADSQSPRKVVAMLGACVVCEPQNGAGMVPLKVPTGAHKKKNRVVQ
jgi:hypothetical protein